MDIVGSVSIVTGGASGLGNATAKMLAANGSKVTILDRDEELGRVKSREMGCHFVKVDVSDNDDVARALGEAETMHGPARILVNCAGICPAAKTVGKGAIPHDLELFARTIAVNLTGTFNMISKFAARASELDDIEGERGVIINTASVAAFDGQIGQAAYSASKGGIVSMTLPVARDLAGLKIRMMTIAPGIFLTPMMENFPQDVQDALGAQVPHPSRLGKPSEYAQLVESIVRNPMLNGEVIRLDGAIRMAPR